MIDFKKTTYIKLKPVGDKNKDRALEEMLVHGESIFQIFKGVRDKVVFTNKRVIAVNVQGVTGKKVDYTSLPYAKVQAFSVETSGVFDLDCELELWFSGIGGVKFEFAARFDIRGFNAILSDYVLR